MLTNNSRVLFVVESEESNAELFETYGEATRWVDELNKSGDSNITMVVQIVNNTYREDDGGLNYDDLSDTFGEVFISYSTK